MPSTLQCPKTVPAAPGAVAPHRSDVQGLRALAVGLVVLAHARVPFLAGGFVGVDVFFVLSGFLITGLLVAEARRNGSISLVDFYVRRARRILPAAALTLLVTDLVSVHVMNFVRARAAVDDSVHAAAFGANFRFAARGVDYFAQGDPPSPFLHFWSLSVEEQFYFVWPLVLVALLLARRRRLLVPTTIALACASFVWSVHATAAAPAAAYFSPFTRAWELALGAAVAAASPALVRLPRREKIVLGWVGVGAIGSAAAAFSSATPFPGAAALVPTLGAALVIVAGMGEGAPCGVGRVLASRPLTFVGDRSYAYYLWHWPVLVLCADYAGRELPVRVNLVLLAAAFVVSCVSYALVENPLRASMRSRRKTVAVAAACMAGAFGAAAVASAAIDREQRQFEGPATAAVPFSPVAFRTGAAGGTLPAVVAAVQAAERGDPLPRGLTPPIGRLRSFGPPYMPPSGCIVRQRDGGARGRVCRVGEPSSTRTIVLFGDSHALMWLPSLIELARRDAWAVVPLIRLGCTPGRWVANGDKTGCREWYRWATAQVIRLHPRLTLVGGSVGGDRGVAASRGAVDGIFSAATLLKAHGRVVVIGDPEGVDQEPVDCLLAAHASMATCTTTWPAPALAAYDLMQRAAKKLDVGFLPTRGFLCFERRCPMVVGHTITRMDRSHLTVAYAVQIAPAFRSALLPLLRGVDRG
jgi:peptidoglycan/LPS O-acetylase OafA/YrhL